MFELVLCVHACVCGFQSAYVAVTNEREVLQLASSTQMGIRTLIQAQTCKASWQTHKQQRYTETVHLCCKYHTDYSSLGKLLI